MNIQETYQKHYLQVYRIFPLTLVKGQGAHVWDENGKKYIDALAGIAVNSVGHCHPKVVNAIKNQAEQLIHISNIFVNAPQALLADKLADLSGLDRVFFANSGAEANEGAFKLARKFAHSKGRGGEIISFSGCFHGRTLATISLGSPKYQKGFEPMPSGFKQVPFNDIEAVRKAISNETAAIILEPVQGESGIHLVDKTFVKELRQLCDETGISLIFDEIQCGIARTGKFFAFEHFGVKPDILTLAKALGGGVPIGAFLVKQEIADALAQGDHGTTFGGNPLACAAALATVDVIMEEKLIEKAQSLGQRAVEKLKKETKDIPSVKEIRGLGLMIGVDLTFPGRDLVGKMIEKGVIGNCTADQTIRFVPPLVISEEDMDKVIDIFIETLKEIV